MVVIAGTNVWATIANSCGVSITNLPDFTSFYTWFLMVPPTPSIDPLAWCASMTFGFIKLWQQHENEARSKLCKHAIRPSIYFISRNVDFLQHVFNYLVEACKSCNTGIIRGFTYNGYRVFVEHCFWPIITASRKDTETRMSKVCTLNFVLGQIFVIFAIVAFN